MGYTSQTIHSGTSGSGISTKNAQDLATALENIDTALAAAGDVSAAGAATAVALTGTLTGTPDGALADITYNGTWSEAQANEINVNFEEVQVQLNALITDVATIRTQLNALIATLA